MAANVRCGFTTALIGIAALTLAAWAQEPDTTPPPEPAPKDRTVPDRPTPDRPADDRSTTEDRSTSGRALPATSTDRSTSGMKAVSPQMFVSQAAMISKDEVELSRLALEKSQDKQVRDYAQRMVRDHAAADGQLKKIVEAERISVQPMPDPEHQAVKQKLASLEGTAFDREYKKEMTKGHDKAVALFESASQDPQMPSELKQFAASTLPMLKDHKELARALHDQERG